MGNYLTNESPHIHPGFDPALTWHRHGLVAVISSLDFQISSRFKDLEVDDI